MSIYDTHGYVQRVVTTANYSMLINDIGRELRCDCSINNTDIAITLYNALASAWAGETFIIKIDPTPYKVLIAPFPGTTPNQTINGVDSSIILSNQYDFVKIVNDNTSDYKTTAGNLGSLLRSPPALFTADFTASSNSINGVDTSSASIVATLPGQGKDNILDGKFCIVYDSTGNAATNPIPIKNFSGTTLTTIDTNNGLVLYVFSDVDNKWIQLVSTSSSLLTVSQYRGNWISTSLPTTGGSGTGGAIRAGDWWAILAADTPNPIVDGSSVTRTIYGDNTLYALEDNPADSWDSWNIGHDSLLRTAADYANFPFKNVLITNDEILIEDSEDSGKKKRVLLENIPVSIPVQTAIATATANSRQWQGTWNGAGSLYPDARPDSTAIKAGDVFTVDATYTYPAVAGTTIYQTTTLRAKVDNPGQIPGNWANEGDNVNKQNLVASATANDIALLDINGQVIDSAKTFGNDNTNNTVPTSAQMQSYVTTAVLGAPTLPAVQFATTANDTLSGLAARDTYTPIAGDVALVKNQTAIGGFTGNNGFWITAVGAWIRAKYDTTLQTWVAVTTETTYSELNINNGIVNVLNGANPPTGNKNLQFQVFIQTPTALFGLSNVFVTATTKIPSAGINNRFIDTNIGNDTNNNGSQAFPFLTIARAFTGANYPQVLTISGSANITENVTLASGNSNITFQVVDLNEDSGKSIETGTWQTTSGFTRGRFVGLNFTPATTTNPCFTLGSGDAGRHTFMNCIFTTSGTSLMSINGTGTNWMTIINPDTTGSLFATLTLPNSTGARILYLKNVTKRFVLGNIGTNWTVVIEASCSAGAIVFKGTISGLLIDRRGYIVNSILSSQTQLNTLLADTNVATDGYYTTSFANPTVTGGVVAAQGDILLKQSIQGIATDTSITCQYINVPGGSIKVILGTTTVNYIQSQNNWMPIQGLATLIASAVGVSDTTINVVSTNGYPNSGTIYIGAEAMSYGSKTSTAFNSVIRGINNTTAIAHIVNEIVLPLGGGSGGGSGSSFDEIGRIYAYFGTTLPTNALWCDGAPYSRTTYSALFDKIGTSAGSGDGSTTFNVPDLRGYFLRGVDGSASRDPDKLTRTAMNTGGNTGNNVGSVQTDAFASHSHTVSTNKSGSGSLTIAYWADNGNPGNIVNAPTSATGGNETRPKNAYVNFIIMYNNSAGAGDVYQANNNIFTGNNSFSGETDFLNLTESTAGANNYSNIVIDNATGKLNKKPVELPSFSSRTSQNKNEQFIIYKKRLYSCGLGRTANASGNSWYANYVPQECYIPFTSASEYVVDIVFTHYMSLAVSNLGNAYLWGYRAYDAFNIFPAIKINMPAGMSANKIVKIYGTSSTQIVTGYGGYTFTGVGIADNGQILTIGDNTWGQLGIGTTTNSTTNFNTWQVPTGTSAKIFVHASVSGNYGQMWAAIEDKGSWASGGGGQLWTCGWNGTGAGGNGTFAGITTPYQVPSMANVKDAVMAGCTGVTYNGQMCRVLKADGTSWAAGSNSQGQLADGTLTNRSTFVRENQNYTDIVAIGAFMTYAANATYIVRSSPVSGGKWYWAGYNNDYSLGNFIPNQTATSSFVSNATEDAYPFQGLLLDASNNPAFKITFNGSVDSGFNYCCIVDKNGVAWASGRNVQGNLGVGNVSVITTYTKVLLPVGKKCIAVSNTGLQDTGIGLHFILDDGTIWGCGQNFYGENPFEIYPLQQPQAMPKPLIGFGYKDLE